MILISRRRNQVETMVLDLGCGTRKAEPSAIGVDISPHSAADVICNLNQLQWPWRDNQFSRIHMSHIIEHFSDVMGAMAEVHRISCAGADVFVTTPHFSSHNSFTDPDHKHHLAAASFRYFTGDDFATFPGASVRFEIVSLRLTFGGNLILDNLGRLLARLSLRWYERHAAWIFPAQDIHCHLRVRK